MYLCRHGAKVVLKDRPRAIHACIRIYHIYLYMCVLTQIQGGAFETQKSGQQRFAGLDTLQYMIDEESRHTATHCNTLQHSALWVLIHFNTPHTSTHLHVRAHTHTHKHTHTLWSSSFAIPFFLAAACAFF